MKQIPPFKEVSANRRTEDVFIKELTATTIKPSAYKLVLTAHKVKEVAYKVKPAAYNLMLTAHKIKDAAYKLAPTAYKVKPSAYKLVLSAHKVKDAAYQVIYLNYICVLCTNLCNLCV